MSSLARTRFAAMMALLDAANAPEKPTLNLDHGRFIGDWNMTPTVGNQDAAPTAWWGCDVSNGDSAGVVLATPSATLPLLLGAPDISRFLAVSAADLAYTPLAVGDFGIDLEWPDITGDAFGNFSLMLHDNSHTFDDAVRRLILGSGDAIRAAGFLTMHSGGMMGNAFSVNGTGASAPAALAAMPTAGHRHRLLFTPSNGTLTLLDIEAPENPVLVGSVVFPVDGLTADDRLTLTVAYITTTPDTTTAPLELHFLGAPGRFSQQAVTEAAIPTQALDGHWLHVTAGGPYRGSTTQAGDYVCLINNRQAVMVLRLPADPAAIAEQVEALLPPPPGAAVFTLEEVTNPADAATVTIATANDISIVINDATARDFLQVAISQACFDGGAPVRLHISTNAAMSLFEIVHNSWYAPSTSMALAAGAKVVFVFEQRGDYVELMSKIIEQAGA